MLCEAPKFSHKEETRPQIGMESGSTTLASLTFQVARQGAGFSRHGAVPWWHQISDIKDGIDEKEFTFFGGATFSKAFRARAGGHITAEKPSAPV